jgi:cytochrome c oxidase subunit 2
MDRRLALPRRAIAPGVVAAFLVVTLTGCVPEPATSEGAQVKMLYDVFLVVAAFVFVIVAGLIGWSILRYRAKDDGREASHNHENIPLELIWWAIPTLLVIVLFILTAQVLGRVDERTTDPDVTVDVTGFQWQWSFAYEGTDVVVSGEADRQPVMVLPVGERVAFNLTSPDVIHSFWVPHFLIKRDVIPGRTNRFEVTIDEAGTYSGLCGEFCGLLHSRMRFSIDAVTPDEFEAWLASGGSSG